MKDEHGKRFEGWAFTFCKAAFLCLVFTPKYALLGCATLSAVFYVLATLKGVKEWRCWAKPPWVTLFWAVVAAEEVWRLFLRQ
jgi:hypothetical protein